MCPHHPPPRAVGHIHDWEEPSATTACEDSHCGTHEFSRDVACRFIFSVTFLLWSLMGTLSSVYIMESVSGILFSFSLFVMIHSRQDSLGVWEEVTSCFSCTVQDEQYSITFIFVCFSVVSSFQFTKTAPKLQNTMQN